MRHTMTALLSMMYLYLGAFGQLFPGPNSNLPECKIGDNHCGGPSLETQILMTCGQHQAVQVLSCKDQLSNILPTGYEDFALCYETATDVGDAVCTFNGTGYELDFSSFSVPSSHISALQSDTFIEATENAEADRLYEANGQIPLSTFLGRPTGVVVRRAESMTGSVALASSVTQQQPAPPSTETSVRPSNPITTSVAGVPTRKPADAPRGTTHIDESSTHPTTTTTTSSSLVPSVTIHTMTFTPSARVSSAASWTMRTPTLSAIMTWMVLAYAAGGSIL